MQTPCEQRVNFHHALRPAKHSLQLTFVTGLKRADLFPWERVQSWQCQNGSLEARGRVAVSVRMSIETKQRGPSRECGSRGACYS